MVEVIGVFCNCFANPNPNPTLKTRQTDVLKPGQIWFYSEIIILVVAFEYNRLNAQSKKPGSFERTNVSHSPSLFNSKLFGIQYYSSSDKKRSLFPNSSMRLRAVPLFSYSPSRAERKKQAARKLATRKLLSGRKAKKKGLQTKPQRLTFHGRVILWCSFQI